jgi:flagellar assembly protein FliH
VEREIRIQRAESAAIEAARQEGLRQGVAQAQAAAAQTLEQERCSILNALENFARERREYFRRVETDVVTLSLAIARKLLHREAQIDPLLLSGIVRVALDQIQQGSQVVLRCSPNEQSSWQKFLSAPSEAQREITVQGDESMEPGTILLETTAGKAAISLEAQLKEIESGFLDLLQPSERSSL